METVLIDAGRIWMAEITPTLTRYALFSVGVWLLLWVVLAGLLSRGIVSIVKDFGKSQVR